VERALLPASIAGNAPQRLKPLVFASVIAALKALRHPKSALLF
jgi:hypothetical protein